MSAQAGKPPLGPPNRPGEWSSARPERPFDDRPGVLEADLERFSAETEKIRSETTITELDAGQKRKLDEQQAAFDERMGEKAIDAEIVDREKRRDAELGDENIRTVAGREAVEASNRAVDARSRAVERYSITSRSERYVYMGIALLGAIAAGALIILTAGQPIEYRFSPLTAVAVSAWAGLRLHSIRNKAIERGVEADEGAGREKDG